MKVKLAKLLSTISILSIFSEQSLAQLICWPNQSPLSSSDKFICSLQRNTSPEKKLIYIESDLYSHLKEKGLIQDRFTSTGSETGTRCRAVPIIRRDTGNKLGR